MSLDNNVEMFPPDAAWKPPRLDDLPQWSAGRVGIDVETHDPNLKKTGPSVRSGGDLVGVSFALEDGPSYYLPIGHRGGDNLDRDQVLRYLRDQAQNYSGVIAGANLSYDLDWLAESGIEFPKAQWFRDVQIADPLIKELYPSYSLQAIAARWGLPGKAEDELRHAAEVYGVDAKAGLWQLPARYVGEYAEQDAVLPLQLLRRQEREIDSLGLWPIYNLESQVLPVLLKMKRRGVRIDRDQLDKIEVWCREQEAIALNAIHHQIGVHVAGADIWKATALVPLFDALGIKWKTTPTGKPKMDRDALEQIDHPVTDLLIRARKVNKLRTTFVQSIRNHMVGDRIHTTFNQLRHTREDNTDSGARFGRLSSANPNLQQQPARDEFAGMWRSIYVPESDHLWYSADYSQQEPRWLTHYAAKMRLTGAEDARQRYINDPNTDNHAMMAEMCGIDRRPAKTIFLGLCYGMGGAKLARQLGLPTRMTGKGQRAGDETQALLDQFNQRAPYVRQLAQRCQSVAMARGFIKTALGRRCNFPNEDWAHKAINRLIQGSSADQMKKAMVDIDAAGLPLQLQVHDEVDGSYSDPEQVRQVVECMRDAVPAEVPFIVDVKTGPSWGEAS